MKKKIYQKAVTYCQAIGYFYGAKKMILKKNRAILLGMIIWDTVIYTFIMFC